MPRGKGPYARGRPKSLTVRGHTSAAARFTDSGFHAVDWTEDLALRAARVNRLLPRGKQLEAIRNAVDAPDGLPEAAVEALVAAGWTELEE